MSVDLINETPQSGRHAARPAPSLWILIAVSTISPLAMTIYLPSMAGMVDAFHTNQAQIQLTMSVYLGAVAVAQLFLGPLSDRYGRRPVIVAGMAAFVLGSVLCLVAPSVEFLIAARVIQGAGGCAGLVIGRAIVKDLCSRDQAAGMIGYVTMGMAVGPMVAPALGGMLDRSFGWEGGFWLILVAGVMVFAAVLTHLPETNHNLTAKGDFASLARNYQTLGRAPQFWAFALTAMFTASAYFAYLGGGPFIAAEVLGLEPSEMGFYFMFVAGGYLIGNFLSGRLSERLGIIRMVVIGSVLSAVAVFVISLAAYAGMRTPLSIFLPMVLVGIGNGICLPSAIAGAVSVRPDLAGAAAGLAGTLQVGFGALTSALVAWAVSEAMWPGTVWPMLAAMGIGVVAVTASVAAAIMLERRPVAVFSDRADQRG
ncbi:multidrug effflux MFS transporter [Roseibium sp. RKSG952]|uniref:multidrug effflux MFS transporter n=1 Tax=Roseibium sp. RKSG952 TaxID=2529384 RepID=UPI0012BBA25A|nr:multidrug effflux MFS transporter [Roseibium sp. RKSG952]MTH97530.1 Bcr/CflA family efflux MFS transporter [Roseibium sp. RKSG952]